METGQHLAALEREGQLLADAAERGGLDAPVPPCQPWRVKDLLRHIRYIHWWAGTHVRQARDRIIDGPSEAELLAGGPPDAELLRAYRDGHRALVATLRSADPAVSCATFLPAPSPLAFWARRQAHETAIHRADAELAAGQVTPFDPEFAADGVDELVMGFAPRRKPAVRPPADRTLQLNATDTAAGWHIAIGSGRLQAHRGHDTADTVVSGPAAGLYLLLWNRQDPQSAGISVRGDTRALALWAKVVQVRWA
ncbi:maleylpyruvate isomerase family mycothiol-dependent enzyme [Trebonia sp.]|uniref:maleylpyruvate isomerase family mycothiol-dependent enzyme n=1 Tax=Trebonia sp. TaxID=2767075 RepID=UPI002632D30B|nr:maleylpyruvate isomerase family mycothiol-dependent enzyme [Trebonia sp.]